jgi:hypothetical protein
LVEQGVVAAAVPASAAAAAAAAAAAVAKGVLAAASAATAAAAAEEVAAWVVVCGQVLDCLVGCRVAAVLLLVLLRARQLLEDPTASMLHGLHPELPAGCPSLLQSAGTQEHRSVRIHKCCIALIDCAVNVLTQ